MKTPIKKAYSKKFFPVITSASTIKYSKKIITRYFPKKTRNLSIAIRIGTVRGRNLQYRLLRGENCNTNCNEENDCNYWLLPSGWQQSILGLKVGHAIFSNIIGPTPGLASLNENVLSDLPHDSSCCVSTHRAHQTYYSITRKLCFYYTYPYHRIDMLPI